MYLAVFAAANRMHTFVPTDLSRATDFPCLVLCIRFKTIEPALSNTAATIVANIAGSSAPSILLDIFYTKATFWAAVSFLRLSIVDSLQAPQAIAKQGYFGTM